MIYGYARVSTGGQTLDAQRDELQRAGATLIYEEKASGAKSDRVRLQRLLDRLGEGDILLVTRLDRLARSTLDLLRILDRLSKQGARFKALADAWADTTTPTGRLLLTVLGGIAEFERELIKARTSEGRARAKARGVKMGRAFKLTAHQRAEALRRKGAGEAIREIARLLNVSPSTISRLREGASDAHRVVSKKVPFTGGGTIIGAAQRPRQA